MDEKSSGSKLGSEDSKRKNIINAAMAEFCNGYVNASTDAIVKAAGVSGAPVSLFRDEEKIILVCV